MNNPFYLRFSSKFDVWMKMKGVKARRQKHFLHRKFLGQFWSSFYFVLYKAQDLDLYKIFFSPRIILVGQLQS